MASWNTYLQAFVYIGLLFFFIPIKIGGPDEFETQFQEYLKQFNKSYDDADVYHNKLEAFKKSLEVINTLNKNRTNDSAYYGLTKFSDMFPEEFSQHHLQINMSQRNLKHHKSHHKRSVSDLPEKIDWRKKNAVTKIHSQGSCGACWAYSTVELIESMHAIQTGKLVDFSVDQIIECAGYGNDGCNGGDVCTLLLWMNDTKFQLQRNSDYHSKSNKCGMKSSHGVQIENFVCDRLVGSENVLLDLLAANGPLAVAINAKTWQNYIGGVIKYHCDGSTSTMNHAVEIVGYDLTANIPHYIVRNSWGEDFGDKGYLYLAIGTNICGLANEVSALRVL